MTLEQALAVWIYNKETQFLTPEEARRVNKAAWDMIYAEASKVIWPSDEVNDLQ